MPSVSPSFLHIINVVEYFTIGEDTKYLTPPSTDYCFLRSFRSSPVWRLPVFLGKDVKSWSLTGFYSCAYLTYHYVLQFCHWLNVWSFTASRDFACLFLSHFPCIPSPFGWGFFCFWKTERSLFYAIASSVNSIPVSNHRSLFVGLFQLLQETSKMSRSQVTTITNLRALKTQAPVSRIACLHWPWQ